MTLVLTPDGKLMTHWGTRDFENSPDKEKAFTLIRNLTSLYKNGASKYLFAGRMIAAPDIKCDAVEFDGFDSNPVVRLSAVLYSAWEAEDKSRALIIANPSETEQICETLGKSISVPPLSAVMLEMQ